MTSNELENIAKLQTNVEHLQKDMEYLRHDVRELREALLSGRGSWKVVVGISAVAGSIIIALTTTWLQKLFRLHN